MRHLRHVVLIAGLALGSMSLGCGGADIGEQCDTAGSADECVDNAICTNEADGVNRCRQTCREQADCPAATSCNGVSGSSTKSCQPD